MAVKVGLIPPNFFWICLSTKFLDAKIFLSAETIAIPVSSQLEVEILYMKYKVPYMRNKPSFYSEHNRSLNFMNRYKPPPNL